MQLLSLPVLGVRFLVKFISQEWNMSLLVNEWENVKSKWLIGLEVSRLLICIRLLPRLSAAWCQHLCCLESEINTRGQKYTWSLECTTSSRASTVTKRSLWKAAMRTPQNWLVKQFWCDPLGGYGSTPAYKTGTKSRPMKIYSCVLSIRMLIISAVLQPNSNVWMVPNHDQHVSAVYQQMSLVTMMILFELCIYHLSHQYVRLIWWKMHACWYHSAMFKV